jgi:transmembrane sensor
MFNNQTLSDVFDQLALLYNVDIQYSERDLRNKYFIGKLEMKDSLSEIMRDIALLNKLSVQNQTANMS